ncbi:MAG: hypothetical protein AB7K41_16105 [Bdellovibrionales bacterium]
MKKFKIKKTQRLKGSSSMKIQFIIGMLIASFAFAQTKETDKVPAIDTGHIEMHEKMAKAHQQAADCLKAGKPADDCRQSFRAQCKEAGEPGQCGIGGPMKGRKGRGK